MKIKITQNTIDNIWQDNVLTFITVILDDDNRVIKDDKHKCILNYKGTGTELHDTLPKALENGDIGKIFSECIGHAIGSSNPERHIGDCKMFWDTYNNNKDLLCKNYIFNTRTELEEQRKDIDVRIRKAKYFCFNEESRNESIEKEIAYQNERIVEDEKYIKQFKKSSQLYKNAVKAIEARNNKINEFKLLL